ncbi:MAG TPA: class I SAM-dependent methyltransferase [Candidatus Avipropionibacterium avicola]|uniref:Class I SAM-dependent methyltransferase n=1 Tax=Candidatus Avipropionibacterium avicola TaxID=2840701 RepID=A0A9D1KKR3_9ACTN|nr:class I SAM-dependent methyltransferase [Candidatus Avipropionibacterium avicola]
MARPSDWTGYLTGFHRDRAGAIEAVLTRSRAGDDNPYRWLARAVSSQSRTVVDIASGAGPVARELAHPNRTVVSVDISYDELKLVDQAGPAVQADALRLPMADGVADVVTSSMGLAVVTPATDVLSEMARIVRPGGLVVLLGPSVRPTSVRDARELGLLFAAMRARIRFPGVLERIGLATALPAAGLRKVEDARERYQFTVSGREDAEMVINGMYLPSADPQQIEAGVSHLVRRISRRGPLTLPIPMRRVVAIK